MAQTWQKWEQNVREQGFNSIFFLRIKYVLLQDGWKKKSANLSNYFGRLHFESQLATKLRVHTVENSIDKHDRNSNLNKYQ